MIVDDYTFKFSDNILDNPEQGVNFFLDKIKGEYKIIKNNYRLFIEKL